LVGATDASQTFAWHVAAVKVFPSLLHEEVPLTVNAEEHVGWQVVPAANLSVQSPTSPLVGALDASQISQNVSAPDASSPASFTSPAPQFVQTLFNTRWLAEHVITSHCVLSPDASSSAAFVFPGGQAVQS
jgi:hypothetical protein